MTLGTNFKPDKTDIELASPSTKNNSAKWHGKFDWKANKIGCVCARKSKEFRQVKNMWLISRLSEKIEVVGSRILNDWEKSFVKDEQFMYNG